MPMPAAEASSARPEPRDALLRLLDACPGIDSVWSLDHDPQETSAGATRARLLAFADERTLIRLRASEQFHIPQVEFLVVVDGDAFASAWGPSRISGSLSRWAWRQASLGEAYYEESRWSATDAGAVVRVRRKAFLTWRARKGV